MNRTRKPVEYMIKIDPELLKSDAERQAERRAAHRRQAADDAISRYRAAMAAGDTELAVLARGRENER